MQNPLIEEFQNAWRAENSLTAEAFWYLRGSKSQVAFEELLAAEQALRRERFRLGFDPDATVTQTVGVGVAISIGAGPLPQNFGRYVVKEAISRGAFGEVYRAEDPNLGREVAIKSPRLDRELDEKTRAEFEREARLICRLDHKHILPVYDFGFTDKGRPYLVTRLIAAQTLAHRLAEGEINFHQATRVVAEIARALHYAHSQGVVHRDVKPANILMEHEGHAWLADFGLGLEAPNTELSQDRSGTPQYWSPEQAQGNSHLVDGRSDIFSLGTILYEAITGTHPFRGSSPVGMLKLICDADARPPRQVNDRIPREIEEACMRALRRNPADRYSTAADFAEDLEAAATYQPQPIDTSHVELTQELVGLVERLAENTHEIWSQKRIDEGWVVGPSRDDKKKTHPDLIPYEQLSREEQDYDRDVVRAVLLAALALGVKLQPYLE